MSSSKPELADWRPAALSAVAALLAVVAPVVVYATIRDLADTRDATGIATALGRLLLITSAAGVVGSMTLEFIKRIGPLRRTFQARQVRIWFGDTRLDYAGTGFPDSPIEFGAPLEILTAQLAIRFRSHPDSFRPQLVTGGRSGSSTSATSDPAPPKQSSEVDPPKQSAEVDAPKQSPEVDPRALMIERWMDSFHVATRAKWTLLMRLASSAIAAALAGVAAAAAQDRVSVVIGLAAAAFVIGGPVAWTTRDVVRIIERRASP